MKENVIFKLFDFSVQTTYSQALSQLIYEKAQTEVILYIYHLELLHITQIIFAKYLE